jgi:hypothetical protein
LQYPEKVNMPFPVNLEAIPGLVRDGIPKKELPED